MSAAGGERRRPSRTSHVRLSRAVARHSSSFATLACRSLYDPQLEAEALSEACGLPTSRLDHAARFGQPLLVLVSVHAVQQVGFAGKLDKIRMGGDQGLAPHNPW